MKHLRSFNENSNSEPIPSDIKSSFVKFVTSLDSFNEIGEKIYNQLKIQTHRTIETSTMKNNYTLVDGESKDEEFRYFIMSDINYTLTEYKKLYVYSPSSNEFTEIYKSDKTKFINLIPVGGVKDMNHIKIGYPHWIKNRNKTEDTMRRLND